MTFISHEIVMEKKIATRLEMLISTVRVKEWRFFLAINIQGRFGIKRSSREGRRMAIIKRNLSQL